MTSQTPPVFAVALLCFAAIFSSLSADVVINEISTTSSDRLLRWDENDQPYAGAGHPWWSAEFDDQQWQSGAMPVGFDLNPLTTNVGSQLKNVSPSLYVRKNFTVSASNATSAGQVELQIAFNDGFIVWVNGIEYARSNTGAAHTMIYRDQVAYRAISASTTPVTYDLGTASDLLVEGENTIAVQLVNFNLSSSMRLDMGLRIDNASGPDPALFPLSSSMRYLPGTIEPGIGPFDPAQPEAGQDWIELHNNGASAADISGWALTDDPDDLTKWTFPAGTTIGAGGYLLVFADDPPAPIPGAQYLHTNFSLSADGEYLGLFDETGVVQSQFNPEYPKQHPFQSYGVEPGGSASVYLDIPTPGSANTGAFFTGKADAPDFDNKGGFYDSTVTVTLTSETPGALIRYTQDGTEPTPDNGTDYTGPLTLTPVNAKTGRVIRARTFANGMIASNVKTHTFLIAQDSRLKGKPALVFAGHPQRALYDPFGAIAINGGTYNNNLWSPTADTDYNNFINRGRPYERSIHAEFYFGDNTPGFRTDCGLRAAASSYSRPRMRIDNPASSPWPANAVQKPSFNLYFRDDYNNPDVTLPLRGANSPFNTYERFRIRAGKNDIRNPFIVDELVRRLSTDMGHGASNGVINTLYINGELKGFYNMVERLREPFFKSYHGSDPNADWDVLQAEGNDNIAAGDKVAWNEMILRLNAPVNTANWEAALEYVDPVNVADYFLLNIYMGMWDWPNNNWVTARERSTEGRWRCYVWDAEGGMNNKGNRPLGSEMIQQFIASGNGELRDLWRGLARWEEYRLLFADRIHKHMFHGGVLDDRDFQNSRIKQRQDELVDEFASLLSYMNNETVNLSKITAWTNPNSGERAYLLGPIREDFRNSGLWPVTAPPVFSQHGGSVSDGYPLNITNESGTIHFTTDGSDPRLTGGGINPDADTRLGSVVDVTVLPLESEWKYNDSDGDLGTAWKESAFDDSAWLSGAAPLGYGGIADNSTVPSTTIPVATQINAQPRQPTVYFRKDFEIDNADAFLALSVSIRSDAAMAVYINGVEAMREANLPVGASYSDNATSDSVDGNEGDLDDYTIDPALLVTGTNVIAVELHNVFVNSSDMVMDLQLDARRTNPGTSPVYINQPVTVKARSFDNGEWSALTEADFTIETVPASTENFAIVEMLYNPAGTGTEEENAGFTDGDQFEFIRLRNIGDSAIDLHNVRFTDGVTFDFSTSAIRSLTAGGEVLIVSGLDAFQFRYGTALDGRIAGEYSGRLNNGGEHLRLVDGSDNTLHDFSFDVDSPWPDLTLLDGHSILIIDPTSAASHGDGTNWMPSPVVGGTPGGILTFSQWQVSVFTEPELNDPAFSGPNADADHDGLSNFAEFALGTPPKDNANGLPGNTVGIEEHDGQFYLTLQVTRTAGERGVEFQAQTSSDLSSWADDGILVESRTNPDGTLTDIYRDSLPIDPETSPARHLRLLMSEF